MAVDVAGITSRLGSSIEQVALPFDATKRTQMTLRATHNVFEENDVQHCLLVLFLVRNQQIIGKIRANPLGQFCWQP
jgi:hypothetical protein